MGKHAGERLVSPLDVRQQQYRVARPSLTARPRLDTAPLTRAEYRAVFLFPFALGALLVLGALSIGDGLESAGLIRKGIGDAALLLTIAVGPFGLPGLIFLVFACVPPQSPATAKKLLVVWPVVFSLASLIGWLIIAAIGDGPLDWRNTVSWLWPMVLFVLAFGYSSLGVAFMIIALRRTRKRAVAA